MKQIKKIIYLLAVLTFSLGSCTEPDNFMEGVVEGGLLEVMTPSLNYVVGNPGPYSAEVRVYQAPTEINSQVDVYVAFHTKIRNADGSVYKNADKKDSAIVSNEKLYTTIAVTNTLNHFETFTATYAQLIDGLSVTGSAFYANLPTNDGDLLIGDYWEFRFVSTVSNGVKHENGGRVKLAVSTRFAGTYICEDMFYWRIGVPRPDVTWIGEEITIESVDAITYKYAAWGASVSFAKEFYFQIDPVTEAITYPDAWNGVAQVLNDLPMVHNGNNPTAVAIATAAVPGGVPDISIKDDVEGKDKLIMVYGYDNAGGIRQFYDVLVKKVD